MNTLVVFLAVVGGAMVALGAYELQTYVRRRRDLQSMQRYLALRDRQQQQRELWR